MIFPNEFRTNDWPTLGVELELQLVDGETFALTNKADTVLANLSPEFRQFCKPEFMQSYVELNSGVCWTLSELGQDLIEKLVALQRAARGAGVRLFWSGTHPFSRWQEQQITPDARYVELAQLMRETVIRPVTFGMHVHVGVPSGDHAIEVMNRLTEYLPLFLAISANSPFWQGRITGHHSHRIELLEALPNGGLPPTCESWDDYLGLVARAKRTGCIQTPKELWWDIRPSAEYGTIEVRICDMPPDLLGVLALASLMQCLVRETVTQPGGSAADREYDPLLFKQNRWRACRFGMDADFINLDTLRAEPARRTAVQLAQRLKRQAAELECSKYLQLIERLAYWPTGAQCQHGLFARTGDYAAVVRSLVKQSDQLPDIVSEPRRPCRAISA
jgi:glutamate---cysteine ligase / carboxylate-amine ligase